MAIYWLILLTICWIIIDIQGQSNDSRRSFNLCHRRLELESEPVKSQRLLFTFLQNISNFLLFSFHFISFSFDIGKEFANLNAMTTWHYGDIEIGQNQFQWLAGFWEIVELLNPVPKQVSFVSLSSFLSWFAFSFCPLIYYFCIY